MKKSILFICIENACRSQMAEGFANHYGKDKVIGYSAGSKPSGQVSLLAVDVMAEKGIDISLQVSKGFDELPVSSFDYVVTMGCKDICPLYLGGKRKEWVIQDPNRKDINDFRKIRDEIEKKVIALINSV